MRPSELWGDGESALRDVCECCPRETGWLEQPGKADTPDCALRVLSDQDVLTAHGACAERIDIREEQARAEREIYEKRMAGDWSWQDGGKGNE